MASTWETRDKRRILVSEMTDRHLLNAWSYFHNKLTDLEYEIEESWAAACSFDGDSMASYYSLGTATDFQNKNHKKLDAYRKRLDILRPELKKRMLLAEAEAQAKK